MKLDKSENEIEAPPALAIKPKRPVTMEDKGVQIEIKRKPVEENGTAEQHNHHHEHRHHHHHQEHDQQEKESVGEKEEVHDNHEHHHHRHEHKSRKRDSKVSSKSHLNV